MCRYRFDLSVEEAAELARRSIYHATFRDGASGGVASGMILPLPLFSITYNGCTAWKEERRVLSIYFFFLSFFTKIVVACFDSNGHLWFLLWGCFSLPCWAKWMEETVGWWCWRASLPLLPSWSSSSGAWNDRSAHCLNWSY